MALPRLVALAVLLLSMLCIRLTTAQLLTGEVQSVTTYPTCDVSPISGSEPIIPTNANGLVNITDTTPCSLIGDQQNVTVALLNLRPDQSFGGQSFVFSLTNLPSDPTKFNASAINENQCSGTLRGQDCRLLKNVAVITVETSPAAALYPTITEPEPYPYGYWSFTCNLDDNVAENFDPVSAGLSFTRTFNPCNAMGEVEENKFATVQNTSSSQMPISGLDPVCLEVQPMMGGFNAGGAQFLSPCPVSFSQATNGSASGAGDFYIPPDPSLSPAACVVTACPTSVPGSYQSYTMRELGPYCYLHRLQPSPVYVQNVRVRVDIYAGFVVNNATGTAPISSTTVTVGVGEGKLVEVDPTQNVMVQILDAQLPSGVVGPYLDAALVTCNECDLQSTDGSSTSNPDCIPSKMSDIPADIGNTPDDNDSVFYATVNPRNYASTRETNVYGCPGTMYPMGDGSDPTADCAPGTGVYCTVPTKVCRQIWLDDMSSTGFWFALTRQEMIAHWCRRCGCNGMPQDLPTLDPLTSDLICAISTRFRNATLETYDDDDEGNDVLRLDPSIDAPCVPGYDTADGSTVSTFTPSETPCQIMATWANRLASHATDPLPTTKPTQPPPTGTQPQQNAPFFTHLFPEDSVLDGDGKYWTTERGLMRESVETLGGTILLQLIINGIELGETISIAGGEFGDTAMVCGTPSNSESGTVTFTVLNTGASTGNYLVSATFTTPPQAQQQFDIQEPPAVGLEVAAGQVGTGQFLFGYFGPAFIDLQVQLTLSAATPGDGGFGTQIAVLETTGQLPCGITIADGLDATFGPLTGEAINLNLTRGVQNNSELPTIECWVYDLFCWNSSGVFWIIGRVIELMFIELIIIMAIWYTYVGFRTYFTNRRTMRVQQKTRSVGRGGGGGSGGGGFGIMSSSGSNLHCYRLRRGATNITRWRQMMLFGLVSMAIYCDAQQQLFRPANVEVLSVSSYGQCIDPQDPQSIRLNCTAQDIATTLSVRITPSTVSTGLAAGELVVQLTNVPLTASDTQTGSGQQCQSASGASCQPSVPAVISFSMLPPVVVRTTETVNTRKSSPMRVPWAYLYFNAATKNATEIIADSLCPASPSCPELPASAHLCQIVDVTSRTTAEATIQKLEQNLPRIFRNGTYNQAMIRCPARSGQTIETPEPTTPFVEPGTSTIIYFVDCYTPNNFGNPAGFAFSAQLTSSFYQLGPMCLVRRIQDPPRMLMALQVNVTVVQVDGQPFPGGQPAPGGGFYTDDSSGTQRLTFTETIQVENFGRNTAAVSQPLNLVSIRTTGLEAPSGRVAPALDGTIVTCSTNSDTAGDLKLVPEGFDTDSAPFGASIINPYDAYPGTANPQGAWLLPTPSTLAPLTNDDPHAMWYYMRPEEGACVGPLCGMLGVDPNILASPPRRMFMLVSAESGATSGGVPYCDLLPLPQRFTAPGAYQLPGTTPGICGTGNITSAGIGDLASCVPDFGLPFLGAEPPTPCQTTASFLDFQDQLAALVAQADAATDAQTRESFLRQARSLVVPNLPPRNRNAQGKPIFWPQGSNLFEEITETNVAFTADIKMAGTFVSYLAASFNGRFVTNDLNCALHIDPTGIQLGEATYSVENDSPPGFAGSYVVTVECGLEPDLQRLTNEFDPTTLFTFPDAVPIGPLNPGQTALAVNNPIFEINTVGSLANLTTNGTDALAPSQSNVLCVYTLFSQGTINPQSIQQDQQIVSCLYSDEFLPSGFRGDQGVNGSFVGPSQGFNVTNINDLNSTQVQQVLDELAGRQPPPQLLDISLPYEIAIWIGIALVALALFGCMGLACWSTYRVRTEHQRVGKRSGTDKLKSVFGFLGGAAVDSAGTTGGAAKGFASDVGSAVGRTATLAGI